MTADELAIIEQRTRESTVENGKDHIQMAADVARLLREVRRIREAMTYLHDSSSSRALRRLLASLYPDLGDERPGPP